MNLSITVNNQFKQFNQFKLFIDIVCDCDKQTDGRTYNSVFTRCTVIMMAVIEYFTNLVR